MSTTWFLPRRRSVFVCLSLVVLLLGVCLYLYSPWHRHSRYTDCSFSGLEHGGGAQPHVEPLALPPVVLAWHDPDETPHRPPACELCLFPGRAPPA